MCIPIASKVLSTPGHHLHTLHASTHTSFPLVYDEERFVKFCIAMQKVLMFMKEAMPNFEVL